MIRSEAVEGLNKDLLTPESLVEHIERFKSDEPYVYSWMNAHAKTVVIMMDKKCKLTPQVMTDIYENICRSYMFMYFLTVGNRDMLVDRLVSTDHYQAFLNGTLDDKHYQFSIDNVPEESDLSVAKRNHQRVALENLRKALLPLIAEDVGMGRTTDTVLKKVATYDR